MVDHFQSPLVALPLDAEQLFELDCYLESDGKEEAGLAA